MLSKSKWFQLACLYFANIQVGRNANAHSYFLGRCTIKAVCVCVFIILFLFFSSEQWRRGIQTPWSLALAWCPLLGVRSCRGHFLPNICWGPIVERCWIWDPPIKIWGSQCPLRVSPEEQRVVAFKFVGCLKEPFNFLGGTCIKDRIRTLKSHHLQCSAEKWLQSSALLLIIDQLVLPTSRVCCVLKMAVGMNTNKNVVGATQTSPCFVPAPSPCLEDLCWQFFFSFCLFLYSYGGHEMAQALASTEKS